MTPELNTYLHRYVAGTAPGDKQMLINMCSRFVFARRLGVDEFGIMNNDPRFAELQEAKRAKEEASRTKEVVATLRQVADDCTDPQRSITALEVAQAFLVEAKRDGEPVYFAIGDKIKEFEAKL